MTRIGLPYRIESDWNSIWINNFKRIPGRVAYDTVTIATDPDTLGETLRTFTAVENGSVVLSLTILGSSCYNDGSMSEICKYTFMPKYLVLRKLSDEVLFFSYALYKHKKSIIGRMLFHQMIRNPHVLKVVYGMMPAAEFLSSWVPAEVLDGAQSIYDLATMYRGYPNRYGIMLTHHLRNTHSLNEMFSECFRVKDDEDISPWDSAYWKDECKIPYENMRIAIRLSCKQLDLFTLFVLIGYAGDLPMSLRPGFESLRLKAMRTVRGLGSLEKVMEDRIQNELNRKYELKRGTNGTQAIQLKSGKIKLDQTLFSTVRSFSKQILYCSSFMPPSLTLRINYAFGQINYFSSLLCRYFPGREPAHLARAIHLLKYLVLGRIQTIQSSSRKPRKQFVTTVDGKKKRKRKNRASRNAAKKSRLVTEAAVHDNIARFLKPVVTATDMTHKHLEKFRAERNIHSRLYSKKKINIAWVHRRSKKIRFLVKQSASPVANVLLRLCELRRRFVQQCPVAHNPRLWVAMAHLSKRAERTPLSVLPTGNGGRSPASGEASMGNPVPGRQLSVVRPGRKTRDGDAQKAYRRPKAQSATALNTDLVTKFKNLTINPYRQKILKYKRTLHKQKGVASPSIIKSILERLTQQLRLLSLK